MLMLPGDGIWNANRPSAKRQNRQDVRTQRIANHEKAPWVDLVFCQQCPVDIGCLVRDHLDRVEMGSQARAVDLGLLVEQITLGDDHERVRFRQHRDHLRHVVQQLDGCLQHLLGQVNNPLNIAPTDLTIGHTNGCLDHGQGKTLDPVAITGQVAHLGLVEGIQNPIVTAVGSQQFLESPLGLEIQCLTVP